MNEKKNVSLSEMGCGTIKICEGLVIASKLKMKGMRLLEEKFNKPLAKIKFDFMSSQVALFAALAEQAGNKLSEKEIDDIFDREIENGTFEATMKKLTTSLRVASKNSPKSNPKMKA